MYHFKNKMKMRTTIFYSIFTFFLFSQNLFSQACGEGILIFNIYTLNGIDIEEFDYEILPVSKELLKEKFYKKVVSKAYLDDSNYKLFLEVNGSGVIIMESFANEIIKTNDKKLSEDLDERLALSDITQKGKIKSSLLFRTRENNDFPIVIKTSHRGKTIYVLGNFFGGCNREASLVWNNKYGKLN